MLATLAKRTLRKFGLDVHRIPPRDRSLSVIEEICRNLDVEMLTPVELASYSQGCPPLFPTPTQVPANTHFEQFPGLDSALDSLSSRIYFQHSKRDALRYVTDAGSQYLTRQRMLYSAYMAHLGPRLDGKTVLDVGCSSGYYSFFCSRLGAEQVLALDARPENAELFRLFHEMLSLPPSCRYRQLDVEFELENVGRQFDLVLALGVLYHVYDHPRFIRNLYSLTNRVLILDSVCSGRTDLLCWANMERTENLRMGIHGPVLQPSLPWMIELLRWAGFARLIYVRLPQDAEDHWGYFDLRRAMLIALK